MTIPVETADIPGMFCLCLGEHLQVCGSADQEGELVLLHGIQYRARVECFQAYDVGTRVEAGTRSSAVQTAGMEPRCHIHRFVAGIKGEMYQHVTAAHHVVDVIERYPLGGPGGAGGVEPHDLVERPDSGCLGVVVRLSCEKLVIRNRVLVALGLAHADH